MTFGVMALSSCDSRDQARPGRVVVKLSFLPGLVWPDRRDSSRVTEAAIRCSRYSRRLFGQGRDLVKTRSLVGGAQC